MTIMEWINLTIALTALGLSTLTYIKLRVHESW